MKSVLKCGLLCMLVSCSSEPDYPLEVTLASVPQVFPTSFKYTVPGPNAGEFVDKEVPADWFKAFFHFTNNGSDQITITSLQVKVEIPAITSVTGATTSSDTTTQTVTCEFTPSSDSALQAQSASILVTLGGSNPKTTKDTTFSMINKDGTTSSSTITFGEGIGGYCSGMDFPDDTYVTTAELKVYGWKGPPGEAQGRLKVKTFRFSTE